MRRLGAITPEDVPPGPHLSLLLERVWAGASTLPPRCLAQALHASASLGHAPPPDCMHGLLEQGLRLRAHEWRAADLAAALWALAALRRAAPPPPPALLRAALAQAEADVRGFTRGDTLARTLWALGALGHAPPGAWMQRFLAQVQQRLGWGQRTNRNAGLAAWPRLRRDPLPLSLRRLPLGRCSGGWAPWTRTTWPWWWRRWRG